MSETRTPEARSRRAFFLVAGQGAGAVVAGAATVVTGAPARAHADEAGPSQSGYRETAHVKRYYELASF